MKYLFFKDIYGEGSFTYHVNKEGGGAHEILGNFADSCEWWRGIFLTLWTSTCTESEPLLSKICKVF